VALAVLRGSGDAAIGAPFGDEREHLALARREGGERVGPATVSS
jgi:hypothetical protein